MRKILVLMMVVITMVIMAGCNSSPNVKGSENIDGKRVVILKNEKEAEKSKNLEIGLKDVKKIADGLFGYYLFNGDIMVARETGKENQLDFYIIDSQTGEEEMFMKVIDGHLFQMSPDNKKLLFVDRDEESNDVIKIVNIELRLQGEKCVWVIEPFTWLYPEKINWMDKKNVFLHQSVTWVDEETFIYSDLDGNVYYRNIAGDLTRKLILDSPFKLDLSLIDNRVIYLKNMGYNNTEMEVNTPEHELFLKKHSNIYLGFSVNDSHSDIIIASDEKLTIKDYDISPDLKRLALYFEDSDNGGMLAVANIKNDQIFKTNIKYKDLNYLTIKKVKEFTWNKEGSMLAYITEEEENALYVTNTRGNDPQMLLVDNNLKQISWHDNGKKLLATGSGNDDNIIYEIILK